MTDAVAGRSIFFRKESRTISPASLPALGPGCAPLAMPSPSIEQKKIRRPIAVVKSSFGTCSTANALARNANGSSRHWSVDPGIIVNRDPGESAVRADGDQVALAVLEIGPPGLEEHLVALVGRDMDEP